ncbi:MAG: hypothetical protein MI921_14450 [Cytophagales bacterium]|nr:hypothetical protein [Cytophagales bacterium]
MKIRPLPIRIIAETGMVTLTGFVRVSEMGIDIQVPNGNHKLCARIKALWHEFRNPGLYQSATYRRPNSIHWQEIVISTHVKINNIQFICRLGNER